MFYNVFKFLFKIFWFIVEAKVDLLQKNVQKILQKLDGDVLDVELGGEFQHRVSGSFQVYLTIGQVYRKIPLSFLYTRG